MAFLGVGARSTLQRILKADFKSEGEKQQLLTELKNDQSVRAAEVVPMLFSSDAAVRGAGAAIFTGRGDGAALAALVEAMQGSSGPPRKSAAALVGKLKPEVVIPTVDRLIKEPGQAKQALGWELALEVHGDARKAYAERAIKEAPNVMRGTALGRLLQDKSAESLRPVLVELSKDIDDKVRERAVEALVGLPGSDVLDVMVERFARDNATVRDFAVKHIRNATRSAPREVRTFVLKTLAEGDDAIRRRSVELLLATGAPDEVVLDILLFCRGLIGWLRERILNTLRTFGDAVLRPAANLLEHPDEEVRMQALTLVEHFEDPRVVGPVCKLLTDKDWWLRITACSTLSRLKNPAAVPYLVHALQDPDARWAAIDALGCIGGEEALRALVGLLGDQRPEVRLEVIQAMTRSRDPRLIGVLQHVLGGDPSQDVRTRAAEVLSSFGAGRDERTTASVKSSDVARPLDRYLALARERGASDIHITVGEPPFYRAAGRLERIEAPPLDEATARAMIVEILDAGRRKTFDEAGEVDFCHSVPGVGRYRANAFVQRRGTCAAFRVIPNIPPTFADIRLPGHLTELLDYHQGIILVTGPAGAGKSTTLAALLNVINETKPDHVITLEDPIEFVHPPKSALVNQREVGRHTAAFSKALRAALREDPDVVMVGEMRDVETVRMALMAAETGHLVIATMHTTSAVATIDRLVESFPPGEQPQVRVGLSESLKYVISQSLVPRADGTGRVAVYEILKGTSAVGSMVREQKTVQLPSLMQISRSFGMQTVDQALEELLDAGLITAETAYARAEKKETFEGRLAASA